MPIKKRTASGWGDKGWADDCEKEPDSALSEPKLLSIKGFAKFFNQPLYADVKIYLGQDELPAHCLMIASQSEYFARALEGNFVEGEKKEIRFTEGSMQAHWRVFEFMYTGEYSEDPHPGLSALDDDILTKHVRVYALADMFLMENLQKHALKKFESTIREQWVHEEFPNCVREIYESTPENNRGLRDIVLNTTREHLSELWEKTDFKGLVSNGGDFVVDLIGSLVTSKRTFPTTKTFHF
ncbi:BTB/POZ domain-containing protein [Xylariaceae sp. FL1651]|nr:BTB/POZ domain-containing protein [Xylariaceae sp. FL1651]